MTRNVFPPGPARERHELTPEIVANLSASAYHEREAAEKAIERLGPRAADALVDVMRGEARSKRWAWVMLGVFGLQFLLFGRGMVRYADWYMIAALLCWVAALVVGGTVSVAQQNAAAKLAELDDPRAVGALIDALRDRDRRVRRTAMSALAIQLSRMQPSDARLLTNEQLVRVYRSLAMPKGRAPGPLCEYLLDALILVERVGDEDALPCVNALLRRKPHSGAERQAIAAARSAQRVLQDRVERERAEMTLLRPVDGAAPDARRTLLRPTYGPGRSDHKVLLRPSDEPDGGDASGGAAL